MYSNRHVKVKDLVGLANAKLKLRGQRISLPQVSGTFQNLETEGVHKLSCTEDPVCSVRKLLIRLMIHLMKILIIGEHSRRILQISSFQSILKQTGNIV